MRYPHVHIFVRSRIAKISIWIFFRWVRGVGSLREIEYTLDVLRADGVSLSSSYGEGEHGGIVGFFPSFT